MTDIKKTLDTLSAEVLYRRDMPCTTVVVALLSSCYGNLETLFKVGALLETGVTLPKRSELVRVSYQLITIALCIFCCYVQIRNRPDIRLNPVPAGYPDLISGSGPVSKN